MASAWLGRIFGGRAVVLAVAVWAMAGGARAGDLDHMNWGLPFAVADGLAAVELPSRPPVGGVARQVSELRERYGYKVAAPAGANSLQADELSLILAAMGDLPAELVARRPGGGRPIRFDPRLERFIDAPAALNGTTVTAISGPGRIGIRLGEGWRRLSPTSRRATIVHEVAHDFARQLARRKQWTANWRRAMRKDEQLARMRGRDTAHVSQYAATDAGEDFAESVVAYVYAPQLLRQLAPHRRHLLEQVLKPSGAASPPEAVRVASAGAVAPGTAATM